MRGGAAALAVIAALGCGAPAVRAPAPAPPPVKSLQLNAPGAPVDLDAALPAGYVTIVDFWGAHCGACTVITGMIAVQVAKDDRVVIRKVDVGDGFTPVARQHDIGALPHVRVFDRQRRLRHVLVGNDCLQAPAIAAQLAAEP